MKETRKPYTVASYEAGKKAETREKLNVKNLTCDSTDMFPFEGDIETPEADVFELWKDDGTHGIDSEFDLFEKED